MLPDKLPNPPSTFKGEMTKEDWEYYYECRKKYDVPITFKETAALVPCIMNFFILAQGISE